MILTNAKLVLLNEVMDGTLYIEDGKISRIEAGRCERDEAIDCRGDYLIPGLVELHTDHMEKFFNPRPNAEWPARSALTSFDAVCAASGITTVLDAVTVGYVNDGGTRLANLSRMVEAVKHAADYRCRVDHLLHLRCEVPNVSTVELFESLFDPDIVKLVSIMDHSPGQRQFATLAQYRAYYQKKYGWDDSTMAKFEAEQTESARLYSAVNRQAIVAKCREAGVPMASHDDGLESHVMESKQDGMVVAEFPTTLDAARTSHQQGLKVLMGAPNVVRGGSHSGNIAAYKLAELGVLDILSSDYYPASLLQAAFQIADMENGYDLAGAIALVTANPAEALGMRDRGQLEAGRMADVVRVELDQGFPMVKQVYKNGQQIY
ncbi:alpha-D-ribose 1-methylphosphonate 5-triphosphate diphosphatase [Photobacterium ganghwense]|uniref:alpha-D-ribose 1-methylphosphonate 5-triphosphate diphosphatase n=1 Tax=Photobacterium ganghwense TaxID=320778 RepID=UPI001A8E21CE|nr:alpha-D-ribose 1-methylphosphonate 5-triphosphate diphosphatase [Photobacterium ganghwense]MBV1841539.1 alpha-D-ribose 1-methylphosphonate 5-triphosphate diphosphatase [Photobacterium ganghwense]QSV17373.1 alpha-D-ribose 1-methylphosphonate 5-triphosphate diphosphatase [Photobacterium ganghwense]